MKKIISLIICTVMILSTTVSALASSGIEMPDFQAPALEVKQTEIPSVNAGSEENCLTFEIVNNSFSFAYDVTVSLSPDSGIAIDSISYTMNLGALSPYATLTVNVPYNVTYTAADGLHEMGISVSCKSGDIFKVQTYNFGGSARLFVNGLDKVKAPVISDLSFDKKSIIAGSSNTLSFILSNPNNTDLTDVSFEIEGAFAGQTEVSDIAPITVLKAGSSVKVTAQVTTFDTTEEGLYDFNVTVNALDIIGETHTTSKGAYFTVTRSSEFNEYSPKIIVDSYAFSPTGVQPGSTATLKINLTNLGLLSAENLKVSLGGYDSTQMTLREVTSTKNVGSVDPTAKTTVEYSVTLSKIFPQDTPVPLVLTLTYSDPIGNYYTDEAHITVMSVKPEEKVEIEEPEVEPVYKTPKIIIESFTTEKDSIVAGEEFNLTYTLKNTSEDFDVENITVLLQNDSSNIFTPVSASYSYFIERIPAGGSYEISIPLLPKINAESNIYAISFSIDYEYLTKSKNPAYVQNSVRETLSVKVVQPINIEFSNVYIPEIVYEGDMFNISFNYNNKSRSNLYFLNIDLEGDFAFLDGKQEMGSIPSGYADMFDGMVQVNVPAGEYEFSIVFNFKDAMNKDAQYKYPCKIIVEPAPVWDEPIMGDDPMMGGIIDDPFFVGDDYGSDPTFNQDGDRIVPFMSNTFFFISIGGAVLVIIIVIITVAAVKKRKKAFEDGADEE